MLAQCWPLLSVHRMANEIDVTLEVYRVNKDSLVKDATIFVKLLVGSYPYYASIGQLKNRALEGHQLKLETMCFCLAGDYTSDSPREVWRGRESDAYTRLTAIPAFEKSLTNGKIMLKVWPASFGCEIEKAPDFVFHRERTPSPFRDNPPLRPGPPGTLHITPLQSWIDPIANEFNVASSLRQRWHHSLLDKVEGERQERVQHIGNMMQKLVEMGFESREFRVHRPRFRLQNRRIIKTNAT